MEPTPQKIIPRQRQRKAAKAVMENLALDKPRSLGEIMASSGYGTGAQNTPAVVTESPGFKQALRDLGLTEQLITTALVDDINAKPQRRLPELTLGAKILGMTVEAEQPVAPRSSTTYNFIFNAETQAEIKAMEDKIKARLTTQNVQPA